MSILKKITAGTLALVLATGVAGSVIAQDEDSSTGSGAASVEISQTDADGVLSASISDVEFGEYQYRLTDREVYGDVTITASDMRGTAGGWNVTIFGTNFDDEFTIDNLGLTAGEIRTTSTTDHSTEAQPEASDVAAISTDQLPVLTAPEGTGAGEYEAEFDATLNIPGGTLVGEYQSTLTVSISGIQP